MLTRSSTNSRSTMNRRGHDRVLPSFPCGGPQDRSSSMPATRGITVCTTRSLEPASKKRRLPKRPPRRESNKSAIQLSAFCAGEQREPAAKEQQAGRLRDGGDVFGVIAGIGEAACVDVRGRVS